MAVYSWRIGGYARDIYINGTNRFSGIPLEYHEPVKQYAASKYYLDQLQNALSNGWITQQEYDETMVYRTADSPTYSTI